jgi:fibrillarin-like rRNA methylase
MTDNQRFYEHIIISHVNILTWTINNNMDSTSSNGNRYDVGQSSIWNSSAQGYRNWWPHIEKAAQRLSNGLVELAEIRVGQRILDIATGIGEPALTAARTVGSTGHVLAMISQQRCWQLQSKDQCITGCKALSNTRKPHCKT